LTTTKKATKIKIALID